MESKEALVVFEGKKIRRTWNNDFQKMKQRDEPLDKGWVQIVYTLTVEGLETKVSKNLEKMGLH